MKRDLAGAFVWSVEMDDFSGVCGGGKYPLLSTVTRVLKPYEGLAKVAPAETKRPSHGDSWPKKPSNRGLKPRRPTSVRLAV